MKRKRLNRFLKMQSGDECRTGCEKRAAKFLAVRMTKQPCLCADSVPVGCPKTGAPRQPFDEFSLSRVTYPARTWRKSVKESDRFARWAMTDVMVIGDFGGVFRSFLLCGHPHACVACGADTAIGLCDRIHSNSKGKLFDEICGLAFGIGLNTFHARRHVLPTGLTSCAAGSLHEVATLQ